MPCVSLLLCLYQTVLVTALPPPTPSNVESAYNDSGCEGPFKTTLHWGWRGDAQISGAFPEVSQDFWPGLSENPPFNRTPGNVTKLEYILPILEEITLRHIVRSSVLPLAAWYCFCEDVVTGSSCLFIPRCHCFARELFTSQKLRPLNAFTSVYFVLQIN